MNVAEVNVYGGKYRMKAVRDGDKLDEIAAYVEQQMKDIEKSSRELNTSRVAVMAALKIAADYLLLKDEVEQSRLTIDELERKLDTFAE